MINFGYTILSFDYNIGGLKSTIRSIKNHYENAEIICVVNSDVSKDQIKEMKLSCDCHKAGKTVTSLINKSFDKIKSDWNILIVEGARVSRTLQDKYSYWARSDKDILFPLIVDYDRDGYPIEIHNEFHNCTLNGLCINKNFFKQVGKLTENPLEVSRQFWSIDASLAGANFKSILGIKIC